MFVRPRPTLLDPIVRAAVLIDLALQHRLLSTAESLEIDTTLVGFGPADDLLRAVVRHPDRDLSWWLYNGSVGLDVVVAHLVDQGVWARNGLRRRYIERDPRTVAEDLAHVRVALNLPDKARDPSVAALASLMNLLPAFGPEGGQVAERLAERCGDAAWLARDLVADLAARRCETNAAATESPIGDLLDLIP